MGVELQRAADQVLFVCRRGPVAQCGAENVPTTLNVQTTLNMTGNRSGRDHLEHRSALKLRLAQWSPITNILVIDDTVFDADVLSSTLRLVFDQGMRIRHVRYLRDIRKALLDEAPGLVFLDDRLGHGASAEVSLNVIRTAGCHVAPIILSGMLTRSRHIELLKLGVADVVHKDDINVARISEAALKVFAASAPKGSGTPEGL